MDKKLLSIASYAKKFDLVPLKKLGQNFIYDKSLCDKIVLSSGPISNKVILEIGPGPAGLTRSILSQNPTKIIVIEKDRRSIDLLNDLKKHYNNLEIMHNDALKVKISELQFINKVKIIANLPYNIGTKLIMNWSKELNLIEDITVMLQKEVVNRICSEVGIKDYGRLSIIMQILFTPKKLFEVSKEAFYPQPKVTSSIVKLIPNIVILDQALVEKLEELTRVAFCARRKKISNSLGKNYSNIFAILEKLSISSERRPEEISPSSYLEIAKHLILA
jgi:16S rRNA (adenine1518-N6/adenine1519-N6)-dimethyltransferase